MRIKFCAVLAAVVLATAATAGDVTYRKRFGDWIAVVGTNDMTDAIYCGAVYAKDSKITYISKDAFRVDMKTRGGLASYRYRFGKAQASEVETAYEEDNDFIKVPVFSTDVLDMPNLRISGETILRTPISFDISLKGLKAARSDLVKRCEFFELLPLGAGAPEWARWQVTVGEPR